ncbi:hypothetical protein QVD17_20763 [Tagetes erecta]|uniref:PGG domain-containing protein n=1 Tax=Tagetes erecta TaxID=13708 RepID=A0AAD8KQI9_TARER|nr:hypothetical protein QVD17_20763 [Tagetes erecta]
MEIEARDHEQPDRFSKDWPFSYFKFDRKRDSAEHVRNSMLVVAALVVAASYGAVMSPPDVFEKWSRYTQLVFIYANTLAWSTSFFIIEMLTASFPFQRELQLSYIAMGAAYGVVAAEQANLSNGVSYITLGLCFLAPYIIRTIPTYIKNKCCGR